MTERIVIKDNNVCGLFRIQHRMSGTLNLPHKVKPLDTPALILRPSLSSRLRKLLASY